MRTLTPTLAAAQRAATQEPLVRILVRDKQARFAWIGSGGASGAQSAMCEAGDGALVVVTLNASGQVHARRITDFSVLDPTAPGVGWGSWPGDWTLIASGALPPPNGDVALSNNGGVLRLFYVGASDGKIYALESTDRGVTWGTPAEIIAPWGRSPSYPYKLASAGHDDLWYTIGRPGYRYVYMAEKSGGSWGPVKHVQYLMETGGEYTNCYGLSAQWWQERGKYAVVASLDRASNGDGRIVSGLWDYATGTLTDYQGIAPPGIPLAGSAPLWPCLLRTSSHLGSQWLLVYWDTFTAATFSWRTPVCLLSRDFAHWSYKVPLGFDSTHSRRMNMAEVHNTLYVYQVHEAYQLDLWYSGKDAFEMTVLQGDVLRYRMHEYPQRGFVDIELDNRDGHFDNPGVAGTEAEALRPLAQVIVEHGLKTEAGTEYVESRPFYFWRASNVRESGGNLCRIHAVDGFTLFEMWRPDYTILWQNKTLRWCIEELAARVGYIRCAFDNAALWNRVVEYFSVTPAEDWRGRTWIKIHGSTFQVAGDSAVFPEGMSGLVILNRLLDLVGGVARFGNGDEGDVLYCFIPWAQGESPAPDSVYEDGEVIAAQYVQHFAWPTRVRVVGNGVAYQGGAVAAGLACGMDSLRVFYSAHLGTVEQCQAVAEALLDEAAAKVWAGWLKARPNVALELFDVVQITDSKTGGGFTGAKRRVNGIETVYEPLRREPVWIQTVYLEGA